MATRTKRKAPAVPALPDGTVLLWCQIPERAVPWSASNVTRNGTYKGKRLVVWQQLVRLMAGRSNSPVPCHLPYAGPVKIDVLAEFAKGPLPDATNVLKAIEDALQGDVIVNDRQVQKNSCERVFGQYDCVTIEVRAVDPIDGRRA